MSTQHLLLMAKAPVPGEVKTRLVPPLTPAQAAALYAAMLRDTVERLHRLAGCTVHVAVSPSASAATLPRLPASWDVFPQRSGDLGVRLAAAIRHVRGRRDEPVVAIGVDSPTLPWPYVRRAFEGLRRADVVLGPTEDGGCYAIGLRALPAPIFAGVAWSTARVHRQLLARTRRAGLTLRTLPSWYDVDTIEDVRRHWSSLTRTRRAPHTTAWLLAAGDLRARC